MYILNLTLFCFNFRKTYLAWNVTYPIVAQPTNETLEPPPFNLTIYKGKKALVEEWYSDSSPLLNLQYLPSSLIKANFCPPIETYTKGHLISE